MRRSFKRRFSPLRQYSLVFAILGVVFAWVFANTVYGVATSTRTYGPYEVLGLKRFASPTDIRKAYKRLVVQWHPDKNKEPGAQDKFLILQSAYELLSNPERRRMYDQYGVTYGSPDYSNFFPIEEILSFTTGGSFHYHFADGISYYLHKQFITSISFDIIVLPRSSIVPQLLLFYGDRYGCTECVRAAPTWRSITERLSNVGMDVTCVHEHEKEVARRMGISEIPAVVLIIDSHSYHYRNPVINDTGVFEFIRSNLPHDLITQLDETNVDIFLNSWRDINRIRVIVFSSTPRIRLRYLLLAYQYRDIAAFGIIKTDKTPYLLLRRFGVPKGWDSILVFKEYAKPVASLSMADIPHKLMKDLVENNKFLNLPRLSSQSTMDTICSTESSVSVYRLRLCVVFLTRYTSRVHDEEKIEQLRQYATRHSFSSRVKFAYVYEDKQREFISALSLGYTEESNLVIIWRQGKQMLSYEWMEGAWDGSNASAQRLDNVLHRLMTDRRRSPLAYHVAIKELTDEHAISIFSKISFTISSIFSKLLRKIYLIMDSLKGQRISEWFYKS